MIHIEPGTRYAFTAGQSGLEIIGRLCLPTRNCFVQSGRSLAWVSEFFIATSRIA